MPHDDDGESPNAPSNAEVDLMTFGADAPYSGEGSSSIPSISSAKSESTKSSSSSQSNSSKSMAWNPSISCCANGEDGVKMECEETDDGVSMSDTRTGWEGWIVTFGLRAVSGSDDDRGGMG